MTARGHGFRNTVLVLVLLPVVILLGARLLRGQASAPTPVHGGVMKVRNLFTYIYGAKVGGQIILFDAGIDESGAALDTLLGGLGGDRDAVAHVFLSHGHFDHVAASPRCTRAQVHVGAADLDMLAHRVPHEPAAARWLERVFPVGPIQANAPFLGASELRLSDGSAVRSIPFPGHTAGSYLHLWNGVLFAGDSMQIDGDHLEFAMAPFSQDIAENRRGIARLKQALGDSKISVVCTGHQACTPEGKGAAMLDELIARAGNGGS